MSDRAIAFCIVLASILSSCMGGIGRAPLRDYSPTTIEVPAGARGAG